MPYHVGEIIIHPAHGGCVVQAINHIDAGGSSEECYILQLLHDTNMTVFVPLRSADAIGLRYVIDQSDAQDILHSIPDMETDWVKFSNVRKMNFARILKSGSLIELANMIKNLVHYSRCGTLSTSDQRFYKDGMKKLVSELSLSLKQDYENMENSILGFMHDGSD